MRWRHQILGKSDADAEQLELEPGPEEELTMLVRSSLKKCDLMLYTL